MKKLFSITILFIVTAGFFGALLQKAQASVVDIRIEFPAGEDCDIGDSQISPANPLCGFIPRTVTITAGDTIRWINNDPERPHQPSSDPHPEHTIYPALNMLGLSSGAEVTSGPLMEIGTWNYHDHLDVSFLGQITIVAPPQPPSPPPSGGGGGCSDCTWPDIVSHQVIRIDHWYATIVWTTDEPSLTRLEFGTTTAYGLVARLNGMYRTEHMVVLGNLLPATKYFYQIYVEDKLGNKNIFRFPDQFFETLPIIPEIMATSTATLTPLATVPLTPLELYQAQGLRFISKLGVGSRGDEVRILQVILAQDPALYPEGLITGYFGPLTEKAVRKFQKKNDIEPLGIVGPKTRAKLNEILSK